MANSVGAGSTICPFYIRESALTIHCEGICEADEVDVSTRISFSTPEQKSDWQKAHCFQYIANCPVAEKLYEKY